MAAIDPEEALLAEAELEELCKGRVGMKEAAQNLMDLFACVATLNLPPTMGGYLCGNYWRGRAEWQARTESRRQEKLLSIGKTDEILLEEIFGLLSDFPALASRTYNNFSNEKMVPSK